MERKRLCPTARIHEMTRPAGIRECRRGQGEASCGSRQHAGDTAFENHGAERLAAAADDGRFDARTFRDASGIGRNLTIQILEYFDGAGHPPLRRAGATRRPAGLGGAGRRHRPEGRILLGGSGHRRDRPRPHVGRDQAPGRRDGEPRLDSPVPHGRDHPGMPKPVRRGRERACRRAGDRRRSRCLASALSRDRRQGRCRRLRRAAALHRGNAAGRGSVPVPDDPRGHRSVRLHRAHRLCRCAPAWLHRRHRGLRRQGASGHLLPPAVCPGDRRGERVEAPALEFGQDRQHPGRLRYAPALASMADCVASAEAGRIFRCRSC